MAARSYRIIDNLIRQANQAAGRKPDSVQLLAHMVRLATADGADPYLVLGVLMEGAAHTLARHVPAERQAETIETMLLLLNERLAANGLR